jgi:hypothetical protein
MIRKARCIGRTTHPETVEIETLEEYTKRQLGFTPKWLYVGA